MPTTPRSDHRPGQDGAAPPTRSNADLAHATAGPPPTGSGLVLAAGQRPLPDYELVGPLGRGGFGEVWKARGPGGFHVALKFVRLQEPAGEAELRALGLMKDIRHAHLLATFGAWQRDGLLVVAMELADGTLLDRLRRARDEGQPGIPRDELLEYLREAAKGLDYLNEWGGTGGAVGIQHKDVKPQNLLLVGGTVKVADFGLARLLEHTVGSASQGLTPAYAAPEFFNAQATRWSDQYSLAITYCQLRGGRLPFEGDQFQVMAGHVTQPPDLTMLPEAERPAAARALAKKPEDRWPSCRAFVEALVRSGRLASDSIPPDRAGAIAREARARWHREQHAPSTREVRVGPTVRRPSAPTDPEPAPRRPGRGGRLRPWLRVGALSLAGAAAFALVSLAAAYLRLAGEPREADPGGPQPAQAAAAAAAFRDPGPMTRPENTVRATAQATRPRAAQPPPAPQRGAPFTNSVGMRFEWVEPGSFLMGSPDGKSPPGLPAEEGRSDDETPHRVTLTKGFHMAACLVTQAQWEQVLGHDANHSHFRGKDGDDEKRLPVDTVSWFDCVEFCVRLSEQEGRRPRYHLTNVVRDADGAISTADVEVRADGTGYRLPSEAQWEYACRGGTQTPFWWGSAIATDRANYDGAHPYGTDGKKAEGRGRTTSVDFFPANPRGLYDMAGNLYQWCEDRYAPYPAGDERDPTGSESEVDRARVLRGGSWVGNAARCRAAHRYHGAPALRRDCCGCRVSLGPD